MHQFGFKFHPGQKTYYVNGHKNVDTVAYRSEYISCYLNRELRCFRWIQLPPHQVNEVEKESIEFNRKDAFKYENKELSFFKTLVDYHQCLANE